jgi:large subunit ribosomal protein L14e
VRFLNVTLGQIVVSRAGRDTGRRFVVTKIIDELFVQICDGDLRRIEKPKKKKVKHLEPTGETVEVLEKKLTSNARISNSDIRKALAGQESSPEKED